MSLIFTHLRVACFNFWEESKVFFRYYRNLNFFFTDLSFRFRYLFKNPYKISRKQGYIYGETPLTTMDHIARECGILSHDIVYDLGCGRGRNLFWLSHFTNCQTHGIDLSAIFVREANRLVKMKKLHRMSFEQSNVLDVNYQKATVIYLYGSDFSDETITKLIEKFCQKNAKIITISFSLNEYCDNLFEIKKEFIATFPWGNASVYLQKRLTTE